MTTLVLLHGFTGAPRSWHAVVEQLPPSVVFMPTLLGHDGSPALDAPDSFEGEVDRIAAEIATAGAGPARLVGYSLGARVALGLLARHRELFLDATLIGVHPGLDSAHQRALRADNDAHWRALLEDHGIAAFTDAWEAQPLFASQRALPARVVASQRRMRLSHHPRGLARSLEVLGLGAMPAYRDALRDADLPLRFIAGERDDKFRRIAAELTHVAPCARATVVPGVGHNVVLEAPERIARLLTIGEDA